MFRIGPQPSPQPATQVSSTAPQGGSGTANQLQTLMASLEKAIAELSTKYGGTANRGGGGDSVELPRLGGPDSHGVGMPGGTIGTHSVGGVARGPGLPGATIGTYTGGIARGPGLPGATIGTHQTAGVPKSGMAGASIGTEKSFGGLHPPHEPALSPSQVKPHYGGMPGATVGTHFAITPGKLPGATTLPAEPGLEPVRPGTTGPNTGPVIRLPPQVTLPDIPEQACGAMEGGEIVRKGLAGGTVGT